MLKTENQIWYFLINQFNQVLSDNGYTGWTVLRDYQPSIQGLKDKAIYISKISKRRIGTQGTITVSNSLSGWDTVDSWYEEILFRVSAFCKRDPDTETKDTITSEDVLSDIMAFVNSALKVPSWKSAGYDVIKATDIRCLDFETDSGLQEKLPQFDFLLCVEQNKLKKIGNFDSIEIGTEEV